MLQISGVPGSFLVLRAGSVAAGASFAQIASGDSNRPIVLPRLFDILALPSSPNTRLVLVSRQYLVWPAPTTTFWHMSPVLSHPVGTVSATE